jgi:PII-like signaling protein
VVEIVDGEAQIRNFLEAIEPMLGSSLDTQDKVQVLRYGHDAA